MIELLTVPASHIDQAWRDGAHNLGAACAASGGEITADQLKMILARGERHLIAMRRDGVTVGWSVIQINQLPNVRVLHVSDLWAPGAEFKEFFEELKVQAAQMGCSEVRCCAGPAQARLYSMQCGFEPVYTTMRVKV